MFWNYFVLWSPFGQSLCLFLKIISMHMFDSMFVLKKIHFDTLDSLDFMEWFIQSSCFEKLIFSSIKGCLDLRVNLSLGLCLVLFLFDCMPLWPIWLFWNLNQAIIHENSQIDTWFYVYDNCEKIKFSNPAYLF